MCNYLSTLVKYKQNRKCCIIVGETQTCGLNKKLSAQAFKLNSSKASADKKSSLSRWCIGSLYIICHFSSAVVDYLSVNDAIHHQDNDNDKIHHLDQFDPFPVLAF